MYSTCLFCNHALGSNEVVEAFPVGRRLAFDQHRGRLWVVCRRCEKWNLTPLEERWEAIETCERLFRDTRKRVSTDNIGLARLSEGLTLVRIGEPLRPEFAAWRYGDQFGRRRRRGVILMTGAFTIMAGFLGLSIANTISIGTTGVGMVSPWALQAFLFSDVLKRAYLRRRRVAAISSGPGRLAVRGKDLDGVRLVPVGEESWGIEVPGVAAGSATKVVLEGALARHAAARVVPRLTPGAGARDEVARAVGLLERRGDPEGYLNWIARNPTRHTDGVWSRATGSISSKGAPADALQGQGVDVCLAVEMALNEENERHALEGELALLEQSWKEAEEIAGIADRLVLPEGTEARLGDLRRSAPKGHHDPSGP